jgi:hypothetical protein
VPPANVEDMSTDANDIAASPQQTRLSAPLGMICFFLSAWFIKH